VGTAGKIIGRGRTADVLEWEDGKVLKLFRPDFSREWIEHEYRIARTVHEAGVSSPRPYELIETAEGTGIVYERVAGASLFDVMQKSPWKLNRYSRRLAQLHIRMHESRTDKIPPQFERLPERIRHSAKLLGGSLDKILRYTEKLPRGNAVCHGDFHPGNVMEERESLLILDWTNAEAGNPAADVARTLLMLRSPYMPPGSSKLAEWLSVWFKRRLEKEYLKEYLRISGMPNADIEAWMLPVAAARLREEVPGEREWLLAFIEGRLKAVPE